MCESRPLVAERLVGASGAFCTVYTAPVKLPLPAPVPPSLLATASAVVSSAARLSAIDRLPAPVLTVTVYVVPLPVNPVTDAPATPDVVSDQSCAETPVTGSL